MVQKENGLNIVFCGDCGEGLANANRIVEAVNFCADTPSGDLELFKSVGVGSLAKLVSDFNKATDELHALARDLSTLRAEHERLKERIGPIDPGGGDRIDELESAIEFLRHDKETLRAQVEAKEAQVDGLSNVLCNINDTCRIRGFPAGLGNPTDQRVIDLVKSLEAKAQENSKAAEWVKEFGPTAIQGMKFFLQGEENNAVAQLRAILSELKGGGKSDCKHPAAMEYDGAYCCVGCQKQWHPYVPGSEPLPEHLKKGPTQ